MLLIDLNSTFCCNDSFILSFFANHWQWFLPYMPADPRGKNCAPSGPTPRSKNPSFGILLHTFKRFPGKLPKQAHKGAVCVDICRKTGVYSKSVLSAELLSINSRFGGGFADHP
jgi:hypothetical protein